MVSLKSLFTPQVPPDSLLEQVRQSEGTSIMLEQIRQAVPDLAHIPQTTYTLYRQFEYSGERGGYQDPYYLKRSMLTRAVLEMILGDEGMRDPVQDLLWSICEETSWVLPAHEEQGPDFWDLKPSPRKGPWGAHTALTREPDAIDLFAAETGASLAETVYLLGDRLAPEVVQRVRQEVERRIFKPYLAYGRKHWWYKGALNWNGVCNGSIGLAFMRLEQDPQTLAEALEMALEGFEAYIATGFEADGGSIEGPGYWSYGMLYYVTLAELLRERSAGQIDLLAARRLQDIAHYPPGMALSPGIFINFGDATERLALHAGIVQRLAERSGVTELRDLLVEPGKLEGAGVSYAKLAIILRDAAWWDGKITPFPKEARQDFFLPHCGVIKMNGKTKQGKPVVLAAKAGHNDGHHSHTDVGMFVVHIGSEEHGGGESLLCDPGRGLYSKEYFRQPRYQNIFCNSLGHSVPRIGGHLQAPGPEFGGSQQYHGEIVDHGQVGDEKFVVIDFQQAYDMPMLTRARRRLRLEASSGEIVLEDEFAFSSAPLDIEEAFVTWHPVQVQGGSARILGKTCDLVLTIKEPEQATFTAQTFDEECRANQREGTLTRLAVTLPDGALNFLLRITPEDQ
jgi:hypothetical protein